VIAAGQPAAAACRLTSKAARNGRIWGGIVKHARLGAWAISLLVAGSAALAISGSLAGPAGAVPARPAEINAAASVSVKTVVLDCPGLPALVRPKTYILSCADGYVQLDKLSWTSWTPGLASATGTLVKNTCTPSCVAGHFRSYRVLVIFWGKAAVKNHPGQQCYIRMTLIYPGARPNGVGQTQTVSLPTSLPAPARA
jgi:hypothetical protein